MRKGTLFGLFTQTMLLTLFHALAAQEVDGWKTDFGKHTVPLEEITSGGPPKDGIPAID